MANFVNDGYKLSSDQLLISEFTKDILDYYNDLVWLMHSQNPDTIQYKDRDILRSRISDKYAKLSADYKSMVEHDFIDPLPSSKMINRLNTYVEFNKRLEEKIKDEYPIDKNNEEDISVD